MHRNSLLLFDRYARSYAEKAERVLEIGPDTVPSSFRKLVSKCDIAWETIDMVSRPGVSWVAQGEYSFPFEDNSFDLVFSAQVIEHVKRIWLWMAELSRVCRPGGHIITINPVNWPYHEAPVDCWRIYPDGMRALHAEAGLETILALTESVELRSTRFWKGDKPLRSVGMEICRRLFSSQRPRGCALDTISIGRKPAL